MSELSSLSSLSHQDLSEALKNAERERFSMSREEAVKTAQQVKIQRLKELLASGTLDQEQQAFYSNLLHLLEAQLRGPLSTDQSRELGRITKILLTLRLQQQSQRVEIGHALAAQSTSAQKVRPSSPPQVPQEANNTSAASSSGSQTNPPPSPIQSTDLNSTPAPSTDNTPLPSGISPELQTNLEELFIDWKYATVRYEVLESLALDHIVEVLEEYQKVRVRIATMTRELRKLPDAHVGVRRHLFILEQGEENMRRLEREKSPRAMLYQTTESLRKLIAGEWPLSREALKEINTQIDQLRPLVDSSGQDHLDSLHDDYKKVFKLNNIYDSKRVGIPTIALETITENYRAFAMLYIRKLEIMFGYSMREQASLEEKAFLQDLIDDIDRLESEYAGYLQS